MIIDHLCKINRNRPKWRNPRLHPLGLILCVLFVLGTVCQSSSAQESASSTKASKVQQKVTSQAKRYEKVGSFEDRRINESSGVASARPAADGSASDAFWTFNDSGGDPVLFRVSYEGKTEAELRLKGAKNRDWESMCGITVGEDAYLAVGDIGDNARKKKSYQIYVIAEPAVVPKLSDKGKLKAQKLGTNASTIEFAYDDGSHNCEAMSYNTDDESFWFIEKVYVDDQRKSPPGIYVLSDAKFTGQAKKKNHKNVANRIADFPVRNVTGMAFSPDNQRLVVRNYFGAWLFDKADGKTWQETVAETKPKTFSLPLQSQGESICFGADSRTLLITSEFKNAFIWKINLDQNVSKEKNETRK